MKFIFFHGAFGNPQENWFPELKTDLEALNQEVIAPQFPVEDWDEMVRLGKEVPPKHQSLEAWLSVFEKEVLPKIHDGEKVVCVGHSLGPVFILHAVMKFSLTLDCAIFVSPFMDELDRWEFNHVNASFYKTDFDSEELKKRIPVSYVLYSDNDPYVSKNHSLLFAKVLDSSTILVRSAGHMNATVHLNEFPLVRDLCYSRLDLSLYQKFLDHYKKQTAQGYITGTKNSGVLKIKPEEVIDEGIFHFRHLESDGFCTLYTGLQKFWDPESTYMKYGREAAKRTGAFTRVIVAKDPTDFHNPVLKRQVELDIAAGVRVMAVLWKDIRDNVTEPDFGIWDHTYVCVVRSDPDSNAVIEAELNSREEDLARYETWRQFILKKATPVSSVSDLDAYDAYIK